MPKYASRLKELRLHKKYSQRSLAEAIGVHPSVLCRIEQGEAKCGELISRRLGDFFMCDWKYFMSEEL